MSSDLSAISVMIFLSSSTAAEADFGFGAASTFPSSVVCSLPGAAAGGGACASTNPAHSVGTMIPAAQSAGRALRSHWRIIAVHSSGVRTNRDVSLGSVLGKPERRVEEPGLWPGIMRFARNYGTEFHFHNRIN